MASPSASQDLKSLEPSAAQIAERYRCGTLQYTKISLIVLFGWMIWGNVCFNLFETQGGYTILNLYLQDNFHVSNLTVNILFNVIPMIMGTIMTPIISFKSDRTRGRWGRRIPYILFTFTAPFLAGFAAAIGFSDEIIRYCMARFPQTGGLVHPFTVALGVKGVATCGRITSRRNQITRGRAIVRRIGKSRCSVVADTAGQQHLITLRERHRESTDSRGWLLTDCP